MRWRDEVSFNLSVDDQLHASDIRPMGCTGDIVTDVHQQPGEYVQT